MSKRRLRNVFQAAVAVVLSISLLVPAVPIWAAEGENVQYDSIDGLSGEILYDTSGNRVMACGGEARQFTEDGVTKWYWFGVDDLEKAEGEQKVEGIHLYSSSDLYNWDYEGVMWDIEGSAHPKMLYNEEAQEYVMWVSNAQGRVSIGTSGSIKGPFTPVSDSGTDSIQGFFNLYEEKPGTAYVIYTGYASGGFKMARLSSDYQSIEGQEQQLQFEGDSFVNAEGGIFKRDNKYYIVNAGMTQYAVADSLTGTWKVSTLQMWDGEVYKDIVDKNQTSSVFRVKTETAEEYVCIGDSVGGESGEVRYIWLPLIFSEDGTVALRELSDWKLDNIVPEDPVGPQEPKVYDSIPGLADEQLYDTEGRKMNVCGGEVHQFTEDGETKWYWFGEDVPETYNSATVHALHLYSSTDLYNWTREEDIFRGMASKDQFETDDYFKNLYGDLSDSEKDTVFECLKNCPTAHPKVLYNEDSHKYVMWVPALNGKQCIATSDSIKGPFKFIKYCEEVSGFGMMYQESDGTAYGIYQGASGLSMVKLADDYMDIVGSAQPLNYNGGTQLNGSEGAMFKRDGKYYIVNTGTRQYAVANSLRGAWTVHPLLLCNYEGQTSEIEDGSLNPTSCILQVNTQSGIIYINISDKWNQEALDQAWYVWLPITFLDDGTVALKELSNWKLDDIVPEEPVTPPEPEGYDSIDGLSGEILYDTDGERVYACGGEVHQFTEDGETKWYWFGVNDLEPDGQENHPGIHLYSSTDLYNWKHEGTIDDFGTDYFIAHPKVLYHEAQKKYVMWVSTSKGVEVATSDSIKGPFTAVENAGQASSLSGFVNLYQDSGGKAYILYPDEGFVKPGASHIYMAELSEDYTRIEGTPQALPFTDENGLFAAEGGIFERNGKFYIINAGSPDEFGPQYAVADSLDGPWTLRKMQMWDNEKQEFEDIVKKNQTSDVFHVKTQTIDTFVCVGDSVNGDEEEGEVRYIWLPIKFFEDGTVALEKLSNWKLDKKDEEVDKQLATEADKAALVVYINKFVADITGDEEYEVSYPAAARTAFAADVAQVKGKTITTLQDIEDAKQELQRAAAVLKETYIRPYAGKTADIRALDAQITAAGNLLTEANKAKDENVYNTLKNAKDTAEAAKNTALTTEVTKDQVTGATAALQEAITAFNNAMAEADARIALAAAIDKADEIMDQEQRFTADSWQKFKDAYEAANAVTPAMTADEINAAAANLTTAMDNLVLVRAVTITGVSLDKATLSLKIGETAVLKPTIEPANATTDKTLAWISDRTDIAKVNQEGIVTGVRVGTANITVRTKNGKKAVCTVNVTAPVEETPSAGVKVSLNKTAVTLAAETEITLQATVTPANAGAVIWSSSNNKVARVTDGKVKAKKAGTARIMATVGNKTATCVVTVVSLSETKLTLGEKESITLKVNGTNKDVAWSSSNNKAATVRNGKVTAKKADKKAITITANVDGAMLTCKVRVKAAPAKLIVKGKKTMTVKRKKTAKLKVSLPKNTAGTLKYKTSNKKVATVDDKGKVKGIKKGTAKITVTAANNKKAKVTLTVKVK